MIFAPGSLGDLLDWPFPRLTVPRRLYRHLVAQMAGGSVWVVRATQEGPPLAIGGVYRFGDGRPAQAWLLSTPELGRHMAAVAGRARAAIRAEASDGPIIVIARTKAGGRIARALGFQPADKTGTIWSSA